MKQFIGTKIIQAVKEIQYSKDGYKVKYPDGYMSWCPKEPFEEAYRRTDGMNFGLAVEAMRKGEKVARAGWNGKGMFIFLIVANTWDFTTDIGGVDGLPTESFVCMKTAQDNIVPWNCNQPDMLADDWQIAKEPKDKKEPEEE